MDVNVLLAMAENAIDVGNLKAACEFYEVAYKNYPSNTDVLEAYAEIMLHYVQDPARAEQMLRHAINVAPNEGYIKYLNLAQIVSGEDALLLYQQAYNIMKQVICSKHKKRALENLRREASECACAIAELYLTDLCGKEDAENLCEAAITEAKMQCNESVEVYQLKGSLRLSQERPEEALEALRCAVLLTHKISERHQPTYESKIELGKLLMQVSSTEAFSFLQEVLQLNDTNPYVWFLLGECARLRKRFPDAARILAHTRNVAVVTQAGDEAIAEIDSTIRLLVEEIGEEALTKIPNIGIPTPLDELEPEENDEGQEGGLADEADDEECNQDEFWEDDEEDS